MKYWLTKKGRVECLHPKPGVVNVAVTQHLVRIGGGYVNVKANTVRRRMVGCKHPTSTNSKPCRLSLNDNDEYSTFVKIQGKPPCLETIAGDTNSVPPTFYKVVLVGQTFVRST